MLFLCYYDLFFFSCFVVMCEFFVYFYDNSTFFCGCFEPYLQSPHISCFFFFFVFACLFCDFTPRSLTFIDSELGSPDTLSPVQ